MKAITPGLVHAFEVQDILDIKKKREILNVDFEITKKCEWKCLYCYLRRWDQELSTAKAKEIIDQIAELNPENVNFTGGEPLLRDDFKELVAYAINEKELHLSIYSNGSLIDEEMAEFLSSYGVKVCLKLDSLDKKTQDFLTGVNGSCEAIMKAISHLKAHGYTGNPSLATHSAVTKFNIATIPEIWKWTMSRNIRPHCTRLVPNGQGLKNFKLLMPTPQEFKTLFEKIAEIENRKNYNIPFPSAFGCIKLFTSCFISSLGDVHLCSNAPLVAGNIFDSSLSEIIKTSEIFKIADNIEEKIKGKCRTCDSKSICYGCRGLTYGLTSDFYGEDPLCWR